MSLKKLLLTIIVFAIGLGTGFFFSGKKENYSCQSNYELLNPQLSCQPPYVIDKRDYISLKNSIIGFIASKVDEKKINHVSVYFRDLQDGPTFGIAEQIPFVPASLLKTPLLITYLGLAEDDSSLLQKKLGFKEEKSFEKQDFPPKKTISEYLPYTIDDLLAYTIEYSDNRSYYVLLEYLKQAYPDQDELLQTYKELGILDPKNTLEDTITVKNYASIFRILFNASYLSKKMSEKALEILFQSDFTQGLTAGTPTQIKVAHKFGERSDLPGGQKQLHDCGIVYYPQNPYLLCVMTQGDDFNNSAQMIAQISRMVYQEVDSRRL